MVKKTFNIGLTTFFLSFNAAVSLFAGEFVASVNSKQVYSGESFFLNLTLKDTSPKDAPAVSDLKKHFVIRSQQNSSNTSIINGKVSSSITWKLTLTPKIEGVVQIPALTVDTADGVLSTQPITVNVVKGSTQQPKGDDAGLNIITKVSNTTPYKNEPFTYTAYLTAKTPLYNVQTQKIQVEDAIVELIGEPHLEERIIEGVLLNVVEFNYLVTPLKAGSFTIPPIEIHGAVPQKRKRQYNSFFDDDFDPFAMMQGFEQLKPFNLTTEEIQLDVQPALPAVSPWLPAKALTLEEQWANDQTLRVGEPFSRSFVIKAEGLKASQLPNLEDQQNQGSTFKVYADKPEDHEQVVQGIIQSTRKEQYTLIPQQAGTWMLPAVTVSWWDTVKKEKKISMIPAREVKILPALNAVNSLQGEKTPTPQTATEVPTASPHGPTFLYAIIAILSFFLAAALSWVFVLRKRIASLTGGPYQRIKSPMEPKKFKSPVLREKEKREKLPDLNPT